MIFVWSVLASSNCGKLYILKVAILASSSVELNGISYSHRIIMQL